MSLRRFGLQLHGTLAIDAYAPLARRAEALGFADVCVHDVPMRRPCWPLLCDIARATSRVRVGPDVTHPWLQHPAVIAANVAHLDELSGGRATLGIGRGSLYALLGMEDPSSLGGLEEAVRVARMLLGGDRAEFRGSVFGLGPGHGLAFGTRRPVPVYLGTFGPAGARLAGRLADGVRAAGQWDPRWAERVRAWVEEGAREAGREPGSVDVIVENWTCLHPDRERARHHARRILATFLPHLGPMLAFYGVGDDEVRAARAATLSGSAEALGAIRDATLDRFMAAGDAGDLRRGLDRLAAAEFEAVSFSGVLGPDTELALEIIGAELARRGGRARTAT